MKWFYADAGKQVGPVEESELDRLFSSGSVRSDTLVWHEGMAEWQTLGAARGWQSTAAAVPALRYAGFWIRFLARVIDAILLGFVNAIIRLPLTVMLGAGMGGMRGPGSLVFLPMAAGLIGMSVLLSIVIGAAYEVYFVSTRGATIGKMVLGLKIIRADGSPVPAGLALGRYFAQWISGIILMIGYIMAGVDSQKRALHDRICETRVIHVR